MPIDYPYDSLRDEDEFASLLDAYETAVTLESVDTFWQKNTCSLEMQSRVTLAYCDVSRINEYFYSRHSIRDRKDLSSSERQLDQDFFPVTAASIGLPDRFQIKGELGSGGFGIVFHAYDQWMKRDVAIKILRPELLGNTKIRMRFLRESQAAARLNHPCIVRILEATDTPSATWQVCERVEGAPLSAHIAHAFIDHRVAATLTRDLVDAIAHAHANNVLHRDIKPDNIMVDCSPGEALESATLRLADFGLARLTDIDVTRMSVLGTLVGTPRYMAPEQLLGDVDQHGAGTDIYSIGMVLYEMLTGQSPFRDELTLQERLADVDQTIPSVRKSRPEVPRDLATICSKCLENRVADRYLTAVELRDDIDRYLRGESTKARPLPVHEQLWRWATRHQALAAIVSVLFVATFVILGQALRNNAIVRLQNDQLSQANIMLLIEEKRALASAGFADELRKEAIAKQVLFEELAWRKGIREAYTAWQRRDYAEVRDLMSSLQLSHPSSTSRIEWRLLRADVDKHMKLLLELPCAINEVRAVPNSPLVAAAADDGKIYLVDIEKATTELVISTGIKSLNALAISRDGRMIATGGAMDPDLDLAIPKIFDLRSGALVHELPAQVTTIESLEFSAENQWLACGTRYQDVKIIDIKTGEMASLPASRRNTWLATSPDGKKIAAQASNNSVLVADFEPPFAASEIRHDSETDCSAWQPDGSGLIHATKAGGLDIIMPGKTSSTIVLKGASSVHEFSSIVQTEEYIAGGLKSGEVVVLPCSAVRSDALHLTSRISDAPITSVAVIGKWLVGATYRGELIRQQIRDSRSDYVSYGTEAELLPFPTATEWSRDGEYALVANRAGEILRVATELRGSTKNEMGTSNRTNPAPMPSNFDVSQFRQMTKRASSRLNPIVTLPGIVIQSLAISPDLHTCAVGTVGHGLTIYANQPNQLCAVPLHHIAAENLSYAIDDIEYSPDSSKLAWTGSDSQLHIANFGEDGLEVHNHMLSGFGDCLAWSPDGRRLAAGGYNPKLVELELATNKLTTLADYGIPIECLSYNAQGHIVSGHRDGIIRFYNRETDDIKVLQLHPVAIRGVTIINGGQIGLSVDIESNVAIWFAENGERIGLIENDTKPQYGVFTMSPKLWIDPSIRLDLLHNNLDATTSLETWDLTD